MTPNEKGRFCNACAKTVVDFSVMTDAQVLNYLIDRQDEKVCGRLLPEQLDTPIRIMPPAKKKIKWYWNAAAAIALLFSKSENAEAQQQPVQTEVSPVNKEPGNLLRGQLAVAVARPQTALSGKVIDASGQPVPFAAVVIKDGKPGVSTDDKGNFRINAVPGTVLKVSAAGFIQTEFTVGSERICTIVMRKDQFDGTLGGLAIVYVGERPEKDLAIFSIKDNETGEAIVGAKITITARNNRQQFSAESTSRGKYKMRNFSRRQSYQVKIEADAYEANEFIIPADPGNVRTLLQEVLLRKLHAPTPAPLTWVTGDVQLSVTSVAVPVCTKDTLYLSKVTELLKPGPVPASVTPENILSGQHAVRIYPNPVSRGNAMHIVWVVKQKGPHMILVNDAAGLLVWQKQEILVPGKIQSSILTDENWSSGMYSARIMNPEGKQIGEGRFIVQ